MDSTGPPKNAIEQVAQKRQVLFPRWPDGWHGSFYLLRAKPRLGEVNKEE